ncbi:MAG: CPBP family intramembrane glutamic endopeptidase [Pyrinomonadaceae bacterium]
MASFISRHPLVTFFILAYAISWGSYFLLSGPVLFPFGSILAAVIVALATEGVGGLKGLLSRCLRWRVAPTCYLVALSAPVAIACGALYLNAAVGGPLPPRFNGMWWEGLLLLPMAIVDAPLWEDSGWRGFAMPRFPVNRSRFLNTLILGILLAGWHLPLALAAGVRVAIPYFTTTILSAFVTNWIYYGSGQSALLAIIYHGAANAMGIAFFQSYSGTDQIWLFWCLAAMNFIAMVLIVVTDRKRWLRKEEML